MEDHSVFYSRNLYPYPNWCQRAHFFSVEQNVVKQKLMELVRVPRSQGLKEAKEAYKRFSDEAYLGFAVIKPLFGCPVGRTVLKQYGPDAGNRFRREFQCTREYSAHLAGVELTVRGLAFQQQDIGVSACATTALWTSLQKVRDVEELGAATPAQITRLASQYTLPFGRSMPSEGLSVDQMCQAVQSLGISPNLIRATNYVTTRGYLHSASKSGFAQVLILENPSNPAEAHAVTVAGMKLSKPSRSLVADNLADNASELKALYVHDDRIGPYLRADLIRRRSARKLHLDIGYGFGKNRVSEEWALTHILIPMHGKIRLSFDELRLVATDHIAQTIESLRIYATGKQIVDRLLVFETLILRSHAYIEQLLVSDALTPTAIEKILTTLTWSRYVGVIRLTANYFGSLDVLIDTTSTPRNINCLGIVATKTLTDYSRFLVEQLGEVFDCPYIL